LIGQNGAAIELDPTDPPVQCLDDTQQPRATGGAYNAGGWTFVQGKTGKLKRRIGERSPLCLLCQGS
jgi:hypothetical protein